MQLAYIHRPKGWPY